MEPSQNDKRINDMGVSSEQQFSQSVAKPMLSMFQHNVFYRIAKKTEKITTALFMVSGFITKTDPLRREIRNQGLSITKRAYYCLSRDAVERAFIARDMTAGIEHLIGLLSIARQSGSLSVMNATILEKELRNLSTLVNEEATMPEGADDFENDDEDFDPGMDARYLAEFLEERDLPITRPREEKNIVKDNIKDKIVNDKTQRPIVAKKTTSAQPNRQDRIIEILKEKDHVTIKDLAIRITNCSEKTLQRDLAKMIDDGLVLKEGDKRWSTYKLNDK